MSDVVDTELAMEESMETGHPRVENVDLDTSEPPCDMSAQSTDRYHENGDPIYINGRLYERHLADEEHNNPDDAQPEDGPHINKLLLLMLLIALITANSKSDDRPMTSSTCDASHVHTTHAKMEIDRGVEVLVAGSCLTQNGDSPLETETTRAHLKQVLATFGGQDFQFTVSCSVFELPEVKGDFKILIHVLRIHWLATTITEQEFHMAKSLEHVPAFVVFAESAKFVERAGSHLTSFLMMTFEDGHFRLLRGNVTAQGKLNAHDV